MDIEFCMIYEVDELNFKATKKANLEGGSLNHRGLLNSNGTSWNTILLHVATTTINDTCCGLTKL